MTAARLGHGASSGLRAAEAWRRPACRHGDGLDWPPSPAERPVGDAAELLDVQRDAVAAVLDGVDDVGRRADHALLTAAGHLGWSAGAAGSPRPAAG